MGFYLDNYRPISFKHDVMIEITKLYILIPVWMTFPSIKVTVEYEMKHFRAQFLTNFSMNLDKILCAATTSFLLLFLLNLCEIYYAWSVFKKRSLIPDFINYTSNIGLHQDTLELICFKLDMMLDTATFHNMISVWMTSIFYHRHRVTGKLELVQ